jgi:hypothetical protein
MLKKTNLIFLMILLFLTGSLLAQPGDPGGGENPTIPFSGVEYVLAIGGLFGLRFLKKKK